LSLRYVVFKPPFVYDTAGGSGCVFVLGTGNNINTGIRISWRILSARQPMFN